jgi:PH (Pleckstrin Homology) domain-containing protein
MVYPPKRDWWVALLVLPTTAVPIVLGAFVAYQVAIGVRPPVTGLLMVAVMETVGGLLLWAFFGTSYEITETHLVARLGPFRWRIPLDAIEEVLSTRGFRLVVGLGLAWSLDMLHVKYRKPNGRLAYPVSISPRDKEGFLDELATAVPGLKVVGDGRS